MRHLVVSISCAMLLFAGCGADEPESAARAGDRPVGAPPKLARLYDQGNELLGGGVDAFKKRLRGLRRYPLVVNAWGSWCGPCRAEFPFFQSQALAHGAKVGFLGVDSQDNDADAREFLDEVPLPYPSYKDPDVKIAAGELGVVSFPSTAFFDRKGELAYLHVGVYPSEDKLEEDIERYAR